MSDSPRTTLAYWQELQKTKCELAAAQEKIADFERNRWVPQEMCSFCWTDSKVFRARIAELEKLIPLVSEVMANHRDPQSGEYNECESSPCMWCDIAQKAIDAARAKEIEK